MWYCIIVAIIVLLVSWQIGSSHERILNWLIESERLEELERNTYDTPD